MKQNSSNVVIQKIDWKKCAIKSFYSIISYELIEEQQQRNIQRNIGNGKKENQNIVFFYKNSCKTRTQYFTRFILQNFEKFIADQ